MPILAGKSECTGCSACVSACKIKCIDMISDEFGFFYPSINSSKCVGCNQCVKVCPICSPSPVPQQKTVAVAAYSKNSDLRENSSSGGVFSEIAMEILKQRGVIFGAAYDERFQVNHVVVDSEEDLYKLRGAKYAQSNICGIFGEVEHKLKAGTKVLFSGTPCQVNGLYSYLGKRYSNLLCIDFVCHGIPSPAVWKSYVRYRSKIDNEGVLPASINLRSKETGWSHYKYSTKFIYESHIESHLSENDIFMNLFVNDYINRLSCERCHAKGYDRMSDITIGDFWGIWDIAPDMDDNKGVSLMLIHNTKGQKILQNIGASLQIRAVKLEQTSLMNFSLLNSSKAKNIREKVIRTAVEGNYDKLSMMINKNNACSSNVLHKIERTLKSIMRNS